MRLKLLFRGDKALLATENGEIIENATIIGYDLTVEWMEEPITPNSTSKDIVLMQSQLLMQIKFDGVIETIPTDVEGSAVEVPRQALIETKRDEEEQ